MFDWIRCLILTEMENWIAGERAAQFQFMDE